MTPQPRYVTKPGCTCVCKDCGAALELACPNGHNPGQYILGEEPTPHAGMLDRSGSPVERARPKRVKKALVERPTSSICATCPAEFTHDPKKKGRRFRQCPECRAAKVEIPLAA